LKRFLLIFVIIVLSVKSLFAKQIANRTYIAKNLSTHFIWSRDTLTTGYLHTAFRKKFVLPVKPSEAVLKIFAYTRYQLFINGKYVCRGPARFENKHPEFDELSVSQYLHSGNNLIAILVHRDMPTGRIMKHAPGLALGLLIRIPNKSITIYTDTSWKAITNTAFCSQKKSWSSISETIDARKFNPEWITSYFNDSSWLHAIHIDTSSNWPAIIPRSIPLLKETIIIPNTKISTSITYHPGDSIKLIFPRILQAYPLFSFSATQGAVFDMRFTLPNGSSSGLNSYTCKSGDQTYIGGDTYAFNSIIIHIKAGELTFSSLKAVEVLYPFLQLGKFQCSDTVLNKIWAISGKTLKLLSEDAYVDCADRERVEWMDCDPPAFDCTRVMMAGPGKKGELIYSDPRLLADLILRISFTQQANGMIKAHTCSERWDKHAIMEDRACDWINGIRKYYESTGNKNMIRGLWPNINKLLKWFSKNMMADGLVQAREWTTWDNPLIYQTCEGATLNAFLYSTYNDAAFLGNQIGEFRQAKTYNKKAIDLKESFNRVLWNNAEGCYYGGYFNNKITNFSITNQYWEPTLVAALFAMDKKIVPAGRKKLLSKWINEHKDQSHAPMSQYVLYKFLYSINSNDKDSEVLSLIKKNWDPMINSPWQTTWEDFSKGSKIHIYGILPAYFLSSFVLGVRLSGPVFNKTIIINPRLGILTEASGTVVTEFGSVKVYWRKIGTAGMKFHFTVPRGSKAVIELPPGNHNKITINGKITNYSNRLNKLVVFPGHYTGNTW